MKYISIKIISLYDDDDDDDDDEDDDDDDAWEWKVMKKETNPEGPYHWRWWLIGKVITET
jgi:hypothetical protein